MSLLTLPAFLTRRREETTMPETTTPAETDTNILMQFLTQGSARVVLSGSGKYVSDNQWRCLGCDDNSSWLHISGQNVERAREDANAHAKGCWSMPKPGA